MPAPRLNPIPEKLLNNDLYQVFVMSCFCGLPISFAKHHWFVINRKGIISRWEILIYKDYAGKSWGHLHLNIRPPFEPLGLFTIGGKAILKANVIGLTEGGEGSLAQKMIEFIENSDRNYPYCHKYFILGPNSNSYVRWVLDHFPEFKVKLPWNGFGGSFRGKGVL